jgi:hypothetical protein
LALIALSLALGAPVLAAEPSVQQCLAASDASIELETRGKLLETRSALRICAQSSCPREIREECVRRIELLQPEIPTVVCEVRDSKGRLRPDAHVSLDGGRSTLVPGTASELELGPHTVTAKVPGTPAATQRFTAGKGERKQVILTVEAPVALTTQSTPLTPARSVALAAGGVGVASLVASSVFAVIALDRKQAAEAICPDDPCPSREGAERWQSAWRAGNFATAFAAGGGVALVVAAGLWFTVPRSAVEVGVGPTRVELMGRF